MQWKNVISDIQARHGLTQPQIAAIAGCAQTTISDLATGKTTEPRHALGQVILGLRNKRARTGKPAGAVVTGGMEA